MNKSLALEMGAYEYLWSMPRASLRTINLQLQAQGSLLPSQLVPNDVASQWYERAESQLRDCGTKPPEIMTRATNSRMRECASPFLYHIGDRSLLNDQVVAVVGTRHPTENGLRVTRMVVESLLDLPAVIMSGLASGIDSAAHRAAVEFGGRTIAVVGTPVSRYYPPENRRLQDEIATNHLVLSHVPILRYSFQDWRQNRFFFPERNRAMASLCDVCVVIESGSTSGTERMAREIVNHGKTLLISESVLEAGHKWAIKLVDRGSIVFKCPNELTKSLSV